MTRKTGGRVAKSGDITIIIATTCTKKLNLSLTCKPPSTYVTTERPKSLIGPVHAITIGVFDGVFWADFIVCPQRKSTKSYHGDPERQIRHGGGCKMTVGVDGRGRMSPREEMAGIDKIRVTA